MSDTHNAHKMEIQQNPTAIQAIVCSECMRYPHYCAECKESIKLGEEMKCFVNPSYGTREHCHLKCWDKHKEWFS